jgi:hypothetical protein
MYLPVPEYPRCPRCDAPGSGLLHDPRAGELVCPKCLVHLPYPVPAGTASRDPSHQETGER